MKELINIQNELKAPKSQTNKFGGYKYRNVEDILEALKPLLKKYDCTINLSDEIVEIGGRVYVKSTATLKHWLGWTEQATAYAREELEKKGMDTAQITGSASSYARKYALNGLLGIDDTKDPDTTNTHGKEPKNDLKTDLEKVAGCETLEMLQSLWESSDNKTAHEFKTAVNSKKQELI